MASILYQSKRIIPCPFMSISKEYSKAVGGSVMVQGSLSTSDPVPGVHDSESNARKRSDNIIGVTYSITLRGTLVAGMKGSPFATIRADNLGNSLYSQLQDYPVGAGSPTTESSVVTDKQGFNAIIRMQESLRGLFAEDGHMLQVHDQDTGIVMEAVVRMSRIEFAEAEAGENWTSRCEYTIELEADRIQHPQTGGFGFGEGEDSINQGFDNLPKDIYGKEIFLREASENWSIEPQTEGSKAQDLENPSSSGTPTHDLFDDNPYTFRVTHSVSAVGKRVYGGHIGHQAGSSQNPAGGPLTSEAWEEAKKWVQTKMGMTKQKKQEILRGLGITGHNSIQLDNPDVVDSIKYKEYNRLRTETVDEYEGSYSVNETWVISKDPYIEDFSVAMRNSNQQGITTISIDGTIRGLDDSSDTNAASYKGGPPDPIYYVDAYGEGIDDQSMYNAKSNRKSINALDRFNKISFYQRAGFYLENFLKPIRSIGNPTTTGLCLKPTKLHPMPVTKSVTINPVEGSINYQVEYDNSPRTTIYSESHVNASCGADMPGAVTKTQPAEGCTNDDNIVSLLATSGDMEKSMETHDIGGWSGSLSRLEGSRFSVGSSTGGQGGHVTKDDNGNSEVECQNLGLESTCDVSILPTTTGTKLYARSESISVQWTGGNQKYSLTPVLGRNYPVAQNLGHREAERLNVNIEAVMDINSHPYWSITNMPTNIETEIMPEILSQCGALKTRLPISTEPYDEMSRVGADLSLKKALSPAAKDFFIESDNESWNPRTGRYTRSVSFVLKGCVSKAQSTIGTSGGTTS